MPFTSIFSFPKSNVYVGPPLQTSENPFKDAANESLLMNIGIWNSGMTSAYKINWTF